MFVPHHRRAADAAKGAEGGEQVDGFEQVGFALGVVSEEEVNPGRKVGVQSRIIAEVSKTQMSQIHGQTFATTGRERT